MRVLLLSLVFSFTAFANTADVNCTLSQPITVETTFGVERFNNADLDFTSVSKDASTSMLTIQDRFGTGYAVFTRLWENTARCSSGEFCLNTDFSWASGLSFQFPNEVLTEEYHSFTMRVRDNRNFRTYFAMCTSYLR
jgi:hypothetical protein